LLLVIIIIIIINPKTENIAVNLTQSAHPL